MAVGSPNYKVILCGEYGVGKSSIFRRFMNNSFRQDRSKNSSIGLDQCSRTYDMQGENVKLTLWDTGGMERMSFIGSSYYRGADAALLCYSVKDKETFSILEQYILDIVMNAEGAKIFLCGNFADCTGDNCVTDADIDNFTIECEDVLSGVYKVSCKDNSGIPDMFKDMARSLHQASMKRRTVQRGMVLTDNDLSHSHQKRKCCSSSS